MDYSESTSFFFVIMTKWQWGNNIYIYKKERGLTKWHWGNEHVYKKEWGLTKWQWGNELVCIKKSEDWQNHSEEMNLYV